MKFLKSLFASKQVSNQSTFCWCPNCNNELISSHSFVSDEDVVTYKCVDCNVVSKWSFDAPVPIYLEMHTEVTIK